MNQIITQENDTKNKKQTQEQTSEPKMEEVIPISPPKGEETLDKEENNRQKESEIEQLKERIRQLESSNEQLTNKNNQLNSFLKVLKEKISDIKFINLNDYQEESEIGEGATSNVKIVVKKSEEKFAKKELKLFDFKIFQRFLLEAEILFKLRHPCIVRIYGVNFGDKTHSPSILLSLEPISLEKAINEKALTNEQKNRITVEIVLGIRYIHRHNFMHRDLKPLNILLSKNLHVRISDFGLAREESISVSLSKGVGTMRFMAPELFEESDNGRGIYYTNKVDVYAFGITLIFIVSDAYPQFSLKNVMNGVLPQLPETIIGWVRELIVRCLSPSPEERPSFAEIFEILKSNNYDLFNEKSSDLTSKQMTMKNEIEKRILKIEAFEYQHHND